MTLTRNRLLMVGCMGLLLATLLLVACTKPEDPAPIEKNTIASRVLSDSNYSLLGSLIARANLGTILDGPGPFTLFAPDDSAFAASGVTTTYISGLSQQQAQSLVLYHVLNSRVSSADLPAGPNAVVNTFAADSIFISKNGSGAFVNGAVIVAPDITVDNGIIHRIDAVLMPPFPGIADAAYYQGLDSLLKAVARVTNDSTGIPAFRDQLQNGTITLFAPTDSAFINFMQEQSIANIDSVSIDSLFNLLQYHVTSGKILLPDLPAGPLVMLSGASTLIEPLNATTGGPSITGNSNAGMPSRIILPNIVARHAVIHVIDRLLLP